MASDLASGWSRIRQRPATASRATARSSFALAIGALTGLGCVLRLLAARQDLWLDEVWSLRLVQGLPSADGVFWRISHDNNHFLNSLWLYWLGPDLEPVLYRGPAVLFGTLSILIAGRIGLRRGRATGLAAAALVSTSSLFVTYGSEARGYAGLILAVLVALDAFDRAVRRWWPARTADDLADALARSARQRWILGIAIGLGALSHLTMVALLPMLAATAVQARRSAAVRWSAAIGDTLTFLRPALVMMVPAMACVIGGIAARGGIEFGGMSPFTLDHELTGFGTMLRLVGGFPADTPLWLVGGVSGLAFVIAGFRWPDPASRWLLLSGAALLPAALAAARLPNLEYPRYFLIPAVILTVALAEGLGWFLSRGSGRQQAVAAGVLAALLLGQTGELRSLILVGRGGYSAVFETIAGTTAMSYASNSRFHTSTIIDFLSARRHETLTYVALEQFCAKHPEWYIDSDSPDDARPDQIDIGPDACRARFAKIATYPTSTLSGMTWTLYRRAG